MIRLRFVKDFPQVVVGEDLKEYGNFKVGDVKELPPLLARWFIREGYAIALIGDRPWYPRIHMKKLEEKHDVQLSLKDFSRNGGD